MGKTRENIIVGFMAFAMLFSSMGAGLLLLFQDDSSSSTPQVSTTAEEETSEPIEVIEPLETPEVYIPEGDVKRLEAVDLVEGDGDVVKITDTLEVHYHGTLAIDGTMFDSSYTRGETATFPLSGVIKGWQDGLIGMREGGTRRLVIPSSFGYGSAGSGSIPPDSDLVFVVELVDIK